MCIRDRYNPTRGQTPTAYFLGKVCIARHLEPRIPDECLVTKLSYHFKEGIVRARLYGQVKTIAAMEALLESYEQEDYYRRNRRRPEIQNERRNEPNRDNSQLVNYIRANNNNNNNRSPPNNRFKGRRRSFNNDQTYRNQDRRDKDNRHPQRSRSAESRGLQAGKEGDKYPLKTSVGTVSYTHLTCI